MVMGFFFFFFLSSRINFIQFCLSNISLCFLSLFHILVEVANTIEKIMKDFLWSCALDISRDHLVSWEEYCCPKKKKSLGLGNLLSKNIA